MSASLLRRGARILFRFLLGLLVVILISLGLVASAVNSEGVSRWAVVQLLSRLNAIENLSAAVSGSGGTILRGLSLEQVHVAQENFDVKIDRLQASWNPYSLLSGKLIVSAVEVSGLDFRWLEQTAQNTGSPVSAPAVSLAALPLGIELGQFTLRDGVIQAGANSYQIESLALNAALIDESLSLRNLHLRAESAALDGDFEMRLASPFPMSGNLQWAFQWSEERQLIPGWNAASGRIQLDGDIAALQIRHELDSPTHISSNGTIQTGFIANAGEEFQLQLEHQAEELRLPYPVIDRFELQEVTLSTRGPLGALQMELQTLALAEGFPNLEATANARLSPSGLQLPSFQIVTDSGALAGSGVLDWSAEITGNLEFSIDEQNPLAYFPAELPLSLENLNSKGTFAFAFSDNEPSLTLEIESIAGQIATYPLQGSASLHYENDVLRIDALRLATSENRLQVSGTLAEQSDLQWEINAPSLEQLLADAEGSVFASGHIRGERANPEFDLQLQGTQLRMQSISMESLVLQAERRESRISATVNVNNMVPGANFTADQFQNIRLAFQGSAAAHAVTGELQSIYGSVNLGLQGMLTLQQDWAWTGDLTGADIRSDFGNWSMESRSPLTVSAQQIDLADNCWLQNAIRLCLQLAGDPASTLRIDSTLQNFSLDYFNAPAATGSELVSVNAIPALQRLPLNVELTGTASAELSLAIGTGGIQNLSITSRANNAGLSIKSATEFADLGVEDTETPDTIQRYQLDVLTLEGNLQDGRWDLDGALEFSSENIDDTELVLRGSANVELGIDTDSTLSGNLSIQVNELAWIEAFVPELSEVKGSLNGQAQIGGSLTAPLLQRSDLTLSGGGMRVNAMGIRVDEVEVQLQGSDQNRMVVNGQLKSGDGALALQAAVNAPYSNNRYVSGSLQGDNFLLLDNEEMLLRVSPAISFTADRSMISLQGMIQIPRLDLQLIELPEAVVDVSRDTVITAYPQDRPDLSRSIAASQSTLYDIPILTDLTINLGEEVRFTGFGLQTSLNGELNFRQQADGTNLTYGELSVVEGNYRAYSAELDLEYGKLLFFGAYDNPALDIRAVRQAEQMTAGVQMNGTLKKINSKLYSSPPLPDNEILAVLITGKPFSDLEEEDSGALVSAITTLGLEQSQGLTNQLRDSLGLDTLGVSNTGGDINNSMLTIGKYLSPSIFVRYGVGLFDQQSTLALDYLVSERITLQAESGEQQSIDISYRIER